VENTSEDSLKNAVSRLRSESGQKETQAEDADKSRKDALEQRSKQLADLALEVDDILRRYRAGEAT
jgi:hypothetical protein